MDQVFAVRECDWNDIHWKIPFNLTTNYRKNSFSNFFPVSYYLKMESYLISGAYPGFFCGGASDAPSLPDTQTETWRRNRDIVHTAFVFILENQAVND